MEKQLSLLGRKNLSFTRIASLNLLWRGLPQKLTDPNTDSRTVLLLSATLPSFMLVAMMAAHSEDS